MKVESKKVSPARQVRGGRPRNGVQARRPREARGAHQGPQTAPMARPGRAPVASQDRRPGQGPGEGAKGQGA